MSTMPRLLPADISPPYSVAFRSDFDLAESIQRLIDATVPVGFDAETTESPMGSIIEGRVHLEHNCPLLWGSPVQRFYFRGSFEQQGGSVVLLGQFIEDWMYRYPTRKPLGSFQPSFREEVLWLSAVVEQAFARPA